MLCGYMDTRGSVCGFAFVTRLQASGPERASGQGHRKRATALRARPGAHRRAAAHSFAAPSATSARAAAGCVLSAACA